MKKTTRKQSTSKSSASQKTTDFFKTAKERLDTMGFQPIWKKVRTELKTAVKILGKRTEKAAEKTVSMGQQAGLQYNIYLEHSKLQKHLTALGGKVYDLYQQDAEGLRLHDSDLIVLIEKIATLEKKIDSLKEKVQSVGTSRGTRKSSTRSSSRNK